MIVFHLIFFEIEITEEAILHKTDIVNQQFSQLRELGFSFALDDLGKGLYVIYNII